MFLSMIVGILVAAGISGASGLLLWKLGKKDPEDRKKLWIAPLGLAMAYAAGHAIVLGWPPQWPLVAGWPPFPSLEAKHWIFYFAIAGAWLSIPESLCRCPVWAKWIGRTAVVLLFVWLILRPMFEYQWSAGQGVVWAGGTIAVVLALWMLLEKATEFCPGPGQPLMLTVIAGATSLTLGLSGSASLAQVAGVLAAALGATFFVSLLSRETSRDTSPPTVLIAVFSGLWMNGCFYSEMPASSAALLYLGTLAGWAGLTPQIERLSPWKRMIVQAAVAGFLGAAAILLAYRSSPPMMY